MTTAATAAIEQRPVSVLLVEDDAVDVEAMRRAFRLAGVDRPITVAGDGLEALSLLRGGGDGGGPPLPWPILVVLDLNLPRMKGNEFLAELRRDPALRELPVFVLTTSDDDRHKAEAYGHNAAGYLVKPHDSRQLAAVARFLDDFCNLVQPPPGDGAPPRGTATGSAAGSGNGANGGAPGHA